MSNSIVEQILSLPVVCLNTANFDLTIGDIIEGKNTIIDLWTTRCTRCPAALDALNDDAITNLNSTEIQYLSICCGDSIDAAREIIEAPQIPRWNAMRHFFMAFDDKERAKKLLNFRQVPFHIVFDRDGKLVYSGNKKPDLISFFPFMNLKPLYESPAVVSPTSSADPMVSQGDDVPGLIINDMDF